MKNSKAKYLLFTLLVGSLFFASSCGDEDKDPIRETTLTIQPGEADSKDAYLISLQPDVNKAETGIQSIMAWTWGGDDGVTRSVVAFDLSAIPLNATVVSAKLSLYRFTDSGGDGGNKNKHAQNDGSNEFDLHMITQKWQESTVTWNNQPNVSTTKKVHVDASITPNQDYEDIDITEIAQTWVSDPSTNNGLLLKLTTEEKERAVILASSNHPDATTHPKLVIHYTY